MGAEAREVESSFLWVLVLTEGRWKSLEDSDVT